jgi:hypothetical protein
MIRHGLRTCVLTWLAAGVLAGCAPSEQETDFLARRALLLRQNQGIRELITEAEQGSIVPSDRFLVGVDERIVAGLFDAQLPIERPVGKRLVARLERATVLLRDKFGAVTIEGAVHLRGAPERKAAVRVHGGLGSVQIDSTSDVLSIGIAIDHIELLEAGLFESVIGRGGKKFLAEKGRTLLQDALPTIRVPVVLGRRINVPAIREGGFRLDSLVVPLDLSVERVIAARSKLWVTLNAGVGKVMGAEGGLGVAVRKKPRAGSGR